MRQHRAGQPWSRGPGAGGWLLLPSSLRSVAVTKAVTGHQANHVTQGAELSAPTSFLSGALTSYSGDEQRPGSLDPYRSYNSLFFCVWLQHADKR